MSETEVIKIAKSQDITTGFDKNASISFELVNDPVAIKHVLHDIFNLSINISSKTETDFITKITLSDVKVSDIKLLADELNKLASKLESYLLEDR